MRLSVFIASMVITTSSLAQTDSLVWLRKPVALFLIQEHYRAESLEKTITLYRREVDQYKIQINEYKGIVSLYKADSVQAGILLRLERDTGLSWKKSFEVEKIAHKETKRQVKKWKFTTVITGGLLLTSLFLR